jgi:transposase
MKNNTHNTHANNNTTSECNNQAGPVYEEIKLGIDQHADHLRIVRMIDGAAPQPALRLKPEQLPEYIGRQFKAARRLYSCYEAGPCGFGLHRKLAAWGVQNVVIRPMKLDELGRNVNTDKTDAAALVQRLDRYVRGNKKAFSVVTVPTEEQEQKRSLSRQRGQLSREKQRLMSMGRSLLLAQGYRKNDWWKRTTWKLLSRTLAPWLIQRLSVFHQLIEAVEKQLLAVTKAVQELAPKVRPIGLGSLTLASIQNEICDWHRFQNRKQPASYTGLCGGVSSSGLSHTDLSITKQGNPRLRYLLIELAWRMVRYQPQSHLIRKWKHCLCNPRAHVRQKKRAIVAVARQLSVDLWRWQTGRITPDQLGWVMNS